jgi:hypothetical protein
MSDANCAQLAASWHRKELIKITNNNNLNINQGKDDQIRGEDQTGNDVALRPQAAVAYGASLHHLAVINTYFKEGGGNAMFQTLTDDSQPAPLCRIIAFNLQLVYQIRKIIQPSVVKTLICEAKEGIPFAFNRYGDFQFKEFIRADFQEVTAVLRELILIATPQVLRLDETLEYLGLHVSSKLLTCSMLQKRYFGLAMINETIENILPIAATFVSNRSVLLSNASRRGITGVDPGERVSYGQGSSLVRRERGNGIGTGNKTVLNAKGLESWLLKNKVFEEIFGESLHQDLVSKSALLIVFLGHRRVLTENHIDVLWLATKGAHEAIVRVVHQMILLVVPVLEPSLRMYLFTLISAVPYTDYTDQILQLIKAYTIHALAAFREEAAFKSNTKTDSYDNTNDSTQYSAVSAIGVTGSEALHPRSPQPASRKDSDPPVSLPSADRAATGLGRKAQRQWLGFGVLWQFVQDPTVTNGIGGEGGVEEGLVDLAAQLLVDLLEEEFKDERELVMQRCLDNIQMGMSVPVSLQLLRKTLATYPPPSRSWFKGTVAKLPTINGQIEKLQRLNRMLDIVFADLATYHKTLVEQSSLRQSSNDLQRSFDSSNSLADGGRSMRRESTGTESPRRPSNPSPLKRVR